MLEPVQGHLALLVGQSGFDWGGIKFGTDRTQVMGRRMTEVLIRKLLLSGCAALVLSGCQTGTGVFAPVTGAGTGTWQLERDSRVWTELQPGSYVFMDADYQRNALAPDQHAFEQSLYVLATVMSAAAPRTLS